MLNSSPTLRRLPVVTPKLGDMSGLHPAEACDYFEIVRLNFGTATSDCVIYHRDGNGVTDADSA